MIAKLATYQIPELLKANRAHSQSFVIYYQKNQGFSYQIIFSKKIKLSVPAKNKIKRQIKQALLDLNYLNLSLKILILLKQEIGEWQKLLFELKFLRQRLEQSTTQSTTYDNLGHSS